MGSTTNTERPVSIKSDNNIDSVFVRQTHDVIISGLSFEYGMRMLLPPHLTSPLLQRVVNEFLTLHKKYMTETLQRLELNTNNIVTLYTCIASQIVDSPAQESNLTWGRVVLLHALAKHMAQMTFKQPSPVIATFIIHVGNFIESKTASWIEMQGGWDTISRVFGKRVEREQRNVLPTYVHTIAGYIVKAFDYSSAIPSELLKLT